MIDPTIFAPISGGAILVLTYAAYRTGLREGEDLAIKTHRSWKLAFDAFLRGEARPMQALLGVQDNDLPKPEGEFHFVSKFSGGRK